MSAFFEPVTELFADHIDRCKRLRVVHPRRAENPDRSEMLSIDYNRRHDHGTCRQRFDTVLDSDRHRHASVQNVADEGDYHELLFQGVEYRTDHIDRIECVCHRSCPTGEHLVGASDGSHRNDCVNAQAIDTFIASR